MDKILDTAIKKLENYNINPLLAKQYYQYLVENNEKDLKQTFNKGIQELILGKPLQYIIGNVSFYGYKINVNKDVLIPRFETEELIYYTLKYIKNNFLDNISILDIGTGSGAIAITLKHLLPNSTIDAIDISTDALEIATNNAKLNNTSINFFKSDIFSNVKKKYNLIISNPPYIGYNEQIMDIVKDNEPHIALFAKNNGLYYYEQILKNINNHLEDKYLIAFEIGCKQGLSIIKIANNYLPSANIIIKKDMQNKDRFIFINNFE
ncbi:MAG: peptide chain release factor N(5)-glutamine methyltransferase [bacterium]|nr:peptide chain release factor N(5)-glutamine methyltransferase [bacterium]